MVLKEHSQGEKLVLGSRIVLGHKCILLSFGGAVYLGWVSKCYSNPAFNIKGINASPANSIESKWV